MNNSRYTKIVSSIILLVSMLGVFLYSIGKVLTPVSYTTYYLHDVEKIKENGEDVDLIILGSSRSLKSFVPQVFEQEMGLSGALNASTAAQPIEGSYYALKELLKDFHSKYVVLSVVFNGFSGGIKTWYLQNKLLVYDRLSGLNRLEYLVDCFKPEDYIYSVYAYRFRNNLSSISEITKTTMRIENIHWNNMEGRII